MKPSTSTASTNVQNHSIICIMNTRMQTHTVVFNFIYRTYGMATMWGHNSDGIVNECIDV